MVGDGFSVLRSGVWIFAALTRMNPMPKKQGNQCWAFKVIGILPMRMSWWIFVNMAIPVKFGMILYSRLKFPVGVVLNSVCFVVKDKLQKWKLLLAQEKPVWSFVCHFVLGFESYWCHTSMWLLIDCPFTSSICNF